MSLELDVNAVCGASTVGFDSFEDKEESQSTYFPVEFENEAALSFQTRESLKAEVAVADKFGHKVTKSNSRNNGEACAGTRVDLTFSFGPDGTRVESAQGVISQFTRAVVGGGHFYHIANAPHQVQAVAQAIGDKASNWVKLVVDDTIPETAKEAYLREFENRLVKLGEAGLDILEACGWAGAGDLQSA